MQAMNAFPTFFRKHRDMGPLLRAIVGWLDGWIVRQEQPGAIVGWLHGWIVRQERPGAIV